MEPLKEMFNKVFFAQLSDAVKKHYPAFENKQFVKDVAEQLGALELNDRMRLGTQVLNKYLSGNYTKDIDVLKKAVTELKPGYVTLIFPDYVSTYGLDKQEESLKALEYFTQYGSSEFAIRHFLKKDFEKVIPYMHRWAQHKNEHVRRLASEGSRPRLPWSFKLDAVIKKPELTYPILERLNKDESLYVRKSVANHLNDISKDNAEWLVKKLTEWDNSHKHTSWIIKHATRSLVKKGDSSALKLLGFKKTDTASLTKFTVKTPKVKLGNTLEFHFTLNNTSKKSVSLVIDYAIVYAKKSGKGEPKVFKLKIAHLEPGAGITIAKKQQIKDFTTRKHYAGTHYVKLLVNGNEITEDKFILTV